MMGYKRGMALRPVHRIKHVVDTSATITAGTQLVVELIRSVDAPVLSAATHVETGSKVNGIYIRAEVASNETDAGAIPNIYFNVWKNPGTVITTLPNGNVVGTSDLKRYCIHQEMVMMNNLAGGNPRTIFNGVIKIPRGYIRQGPDDRLQVTFFSTAVNAAVCLQAHYKEFR